MLRKGLLNTNDTVGFTFIIVFPFFFFFFFNCFSRTGTTDASSKDETPVSQRWWNKTPSSFDPYDHAGRNSFSKLRKFLVLTNCFQIISNHVVAKTI